MGGGPSSYYSTWGSTSKRIQELESDIWEYQIDLEKTQHQCELMLRQNQELSEKNQKLAEKSRSQVERNRQLNHQVKLAESNLYESRSFVQPTDSGDINSVLRLFRELESAIDDLIFKMIPVMVPVFVEKYQDRCIIEPDLVSSDSLARRMVKEGAEVGEFLMKGFEFIVKHRLLQDIFHPFSLSAANRELENLYKDIQGSQTQGMVSRWRCMTISSIIRRDDTVELVVNQFVDLVIDLCEKLSNRVDYQFEGKTFIPDLEKIVRHSIAIRQDLQINYLSYEVEVGHGDGEMKKLESLEKFQIIIATSEPDGNDGIKIRRKIIQDGISTYIKPFFTTPMTYSQTVSNPVRRGEKANEKLVDVDLPEPEPEL